LLHRYFPPDDAGCRADVFVKVHGRPRQFSVLLDATVGALCEASGARGPFKSGATYLVERARSLASYGITSGATLEDMMGGLRGGGCCPSKPQDCQESGLLQSVPPPVDIDAVEMHVSRVATELAAIALEDGEGTAEPHSEEAVVDAGADAIVRVESAPAATLSAAAMPSVPGAPASLPPAGAPPLRSAPTAIASSAHAPQADDPIAVLSKLDEYLIAKLSAGDIRLVRSAWLLLPSVTKMRKRQELESIKEQGASQDVSPLLSYHEAAALVGRGTRSAAVLSHGWLLSGDCDPKAERLVLVKQALAEHPHIEGLFWE